MVQIRSGGSFRHSQHLADLAVCETFHVVHDYHRALAARQCSQSRAEPPAQFIRLGRISKRRSHRFMELIRIPDLSPPAYVERRIGHNARKPCPERLVWFEARECFVGVQETFLHGVLRVLASDCYSTCNSERAHLMPSYELRECFTAPALRLEDERSLGLASWPLRRRLVVVWHGKRAKGGGHIYESLCSHKRIAYRER